MAKLEIPERRKKGFEYFIALEDELRNKLISELNNIPIELSLEEIVEELSKKLNLNKNELFEIIKTFFSLFFVNESYEIDLNTFIDDITEALEETKEKKLKPDENFNNQLKKLLSSKGSFYVVFKANRLISEREKLLVNTRILTDVRPVFNEEKDCKIESFLVIHNLKIEYHERDEHKEIYFALDNNDLKRLKEFIEKAEEKEKVIKEQLKTIKVPFLIRNF